MCRKEKPHMQKIDDLGIFSLKNTDLKLFSHLENSGHYILIQSCPLKYKLVMLRVFYLKIIILGLNTFLFL